MGKGYSALYINFIPLKFLIYNRSLTPVLQKYHFRSPSTMSTLIKKLSQNQSGRGRRTFVKFWRTCGLRVLQVTWTFFELRLDCWAVCNVICTGVYNYLPLHFLLNNLPRPKSDVCGRTEEVTQGKFFFLVLRYLPPMLFADILKKSLFCFLCFLQSKRDQHNVHPRSQ